MIPSPPQAIAEGPSSTGDSPSIPMSVKTRRANEFFSTLSRIDFAQVTTETVFGDGVQAFQVQDQE